MDNFTQIAAFCQPMASQLKATTHALISVDNSKHQSSAIFELSEDGKIHVFSRNIDNPKSVSQESILPFHISHDAPDLPPHHPQILHNLCFSFLLRITAVSREIENKAYAKF